MNKLKTIDIHIDCAPTLRLQEPLGQEVFKILNQDYRKPDITFFGDWCWKNIKTDKETEEKIGEFLKKAYDNNLVRYVSW